MKIRKVIRKKFFLSTLNSLVSGENNQKIVYFENQQNILRILDKSKFIETIIPKYFKHSSYTSFIRQMNKYNYKLIRIDKNTIEFVLQPKSNDTLDDLITTLKTIQQSQIQLKYQIIEVENQQRSLYKSLIDLQKQYLQISINEKSKGLQMHKFMKNFSKAIQSQIFKNFMMSAIQYGFSLANDGETQSTNLSPQCFTKQFAQLSPLFLDIQNQDDSF